MPVKKHKASHKKHPKHYAKVYWPYIPLILVVGFALWLSYPSVSRSQRGVLSYDTQISSHTLLESTNRQRQAGTTNELALNSTLSQAAQAKAEDMAKRNYWSHATPEGALPWTFIDQTGYGYHRAAENLAYGFGSSEETIRGWLNSPTHRDVMLSDQYTEVGFGIAESEAYQGKGQETIIVAFYAEPAGASQSAVLGETAPLPEDSKSISRAQSLTNGSLPWIGALIGLAVGAVTIYLLIKHSVAVHRALRKGERFVLKHPVWDATAVAVIVLCVLLSQSTGVIR